MSNRCKCGSYAINHNAHGRDGSDDDLCDVCYWRKRADVLLAALQLVAGEVTSCIRPTSADSYLPSDIVREVHQALTNVTGDQSWTA